MALPRIQTATAAVWAAFLCSSFIVSPIPGVNEPHYLCKAKHFWQPDWCAGDLFLESSSPHFVFYLVVGWLTWLFPLPVVAVLGRMAALLWLAVGWTQLAQRMTGSLLKALPAAGAFLLLQGVGDFSGEWIIGGVEAKVFAYAAWFQAVAWGIDRRWRRLGISLGLAVSFHPVTGLWGVLALGMVATIEWSRKRLGLPHEAKPDPDQPVGITTTSAPSTSLEKVSFREIVFAVTGFAVAAAPGLIPAVMLLLEPVSARTAFEGDYLQVFYRLPHHLDPMQFPSGAYWWYGLLLLVWVGLIGINRQQRGSTRLLTGLIIASLLIALVGFAAGFGPRPPAEMPGYAWRMKILKFYPFRLFDVMLPLGISMEMVRAFRFHGSAISVSPEVANRRARWLAVLLLLMGLGLGIASNDRASNPSRMTDEVHRQWLTACRWIRDNTPTDTMVATPRNSWAFKWYAQRPEYVTFKDAPQDARGLVEWNRRQRAMQAWASEAYADRQYTAKELQELADSENIDYLIARRLGPMEIAPVFETPAFRIYRLR